MKKIKFNPELLSEEAKRFKRLIEFDFHYDENISSGNSLLLGNDLEEADENPEDLQQDVADVNNELGISDETPDNGEMGGEVPVEEPIDDEMPTDGGEEMGPDFTEPEEPATDDVEIDVTSIVNGTEEAKNAAVQAIEASERNAQQVMQKIDALASRIASMDAMSAKIEDLEKEIVKRNPTPVEKLEMRSFSSYPYSLKLSDYWEDKEGPYDVMDKQKKEYVLTKDDVDSGFSYSQVKNTFDEPTDQQEYEEEDI
jgi:hypothetical protein